MLDHKTGTRQEWLAARLELLDGVTLCAVSLAPFAKLRDYRRRMGWSFPWASSAGSDFNYDFHTTHTAQEWQSGAVEYNFHAMDVRPPESGEENSFLGRNENGFWWRRHDEYGR